MEADYDSEGNQLLGYAMCVYCDVRLQPVEVVPASEVEDSTKRIPAGPISEYTELIWFGPTAFVNAAKHEQVVERLTKERDHFDDEAERLGLAKEEYRTEVRRLWEALGQIVRLHERANDRTEPAYWMVSEAETIARAALADRSEGNHADYERPDVAKQRPRHLDRSEDG